MKDEAKQFLDFEARMLAERYAYLKERDIQNWKKQLQMLGFQATFAAAPFLFEREFPLSAFRIWGVGGLWLTCAILFAANRDFRAYGLHLKERVYCLFQISVIRRRCLSDDVEYSEMSILPMGGLAPRREKAGRSAANERKDSLIRKSFPEYLEPKAIKTASHLFKILCMFPMVYCYVFLAAIVYPSIFAGDPTSNLLLVLLVVFATSGSLFYWLEKCRRSCLGMQLTIFEARRISTEFHWPLMNWDRVESEESELLRKKKLLPPSVKRKIYWALGVMNFLVGCIALLQYYYSPQAMAFIHPFVLPMVSLLGILTVAVFIYVYISMDRELTALVVRLRDIWDTEYSSHRVDVAEPVFVLGDPKHEP